MSGTARFGLSLLSAGQAQKEITVNESFQALDLLVAPAVEQDMLSDPPSAPAVGECYIVGTSPSGDWAGKPQTVAGYTSGGWRFVGPSEGLSVYIKSSGLSATYRSGAWETGVLRGSSVVIGGKQVLGTRASAIAAPSGGSTADAESRATIDAILAALRQHGLIET